MSASVSAIARSQAGTATYLTPSGPLTGDTVPALGEAVDACIAAGKTTLVLDLHRVTLLGSAALEALIAAHGRLTARGGKLQFAEPSTLVRDILIANRLIDAAGAGQHAPHTVLPFGARPIFEQRKKLGDILVEMGLITEEQLAKALGAQAPGSRRLGDWLVANTRLTEADLLKALSRQTGIPCISLRPGLYETAAAALLPKELARRLRVLPMFKVRDALTLATSDPHAMPVLDEIEDITGCKLRLVLASAEEITKSQFDAYSGGTDLSPARAENVPTDLQLVEAPATDHSVIDEMAAASPVINLVNGLIQRAVRDGASDVHIEPLRTRSVVRFRIDGVLYEALTLRPDVHPALVSRLKVMANLDIAERRMPQDGRIQVITQGRNVDVRFSSLPGIHGEKVVLRVLDKNQSILDLEKLGMRPTNLEVFKKLLRRSYGLILVTGPTGSGKTTSLYGAINYLSSVEKNIVTIEDPVEYQLDNINQNPVNEAIGLGFAKMLKHILRQDPDIILVGEIRDRETALIAVQAALTGHLVLSTLHTNDALGALTRMVDMGVEPYLLSSALAGVLAQRLVRQVCQACKHTFLASPALAQLHGLPPQARLSKGRGCPACYDSGYRGRMAIHEIVECGEDLQRLMIKNPTREELQAFAKTGFSSTLFSDGLHRVLEGRTTLEEVSRVIHAS
jgi:type IV pilus assembly protein PilB